MPTKATVQVAGEQLFEELLTIRGYTFERIKCNTLPTPDYKIHSSSGVLICEAKDFGEDELSLRQQQAIENGKVFVTNYGPEQRLRRRVTKAWSQLSRYTNDATTVVLFSQFAIPYADDVICKNHLPDIFVQFPLMSGIIVIEKIKPQIIKEPRLQLSIRETAELWYKELLQSWQIRARVYKNTNATNQFPAELFCDQPDESVFVN